MNKNKTEAFGVGLAIAFVVCGYADETSTHKVEPKTLHVLKASDVPETAVVKWKVLDPLTFDFRSFEHGRSVVFYTGETARSIVFECHVVDFDAKRWDTTRHIVQVGRPGPVPPDPDEPPQPPDDDIELSTIGKSAFDGAKTELKSKEARAHIKAVADNFDSVASMIVAGTRMTLTAATTRVGELNRPLIADDREWHYWLTKVGYVMDRLEDRGKIKSIKQKGQAFADIAAGLRKAVK